MESLALDTHSEHLITPLLEQYAKHGLRALHEFEPKRRELLLSAMFCEHCRRTFGELLGSPDELGVISWLLTGELPAQRERLHEQLEWAKPEWFKTEQQLELLCLPIVRGWGSSSQHTELLGILERIPSEQPLSNIPRKLRSQVLGFVQALTTYDSVLRLALLNLRRSPTDILDTALDLDKQVLTIGGEPTQVTLENIAAAVARRLDLKPDEAHVVVEEFARMQGTHDELFFFADRDMSFTPGMDT